MVQVIQTVLHAQGHHSYSVATNGELMLSSIRSGMINGQVGIECMNLCISVDLVQLIARIVQALTTVKVAMPTIM